MKNWKGASKHWNPDLFSKRTMTDEQSPASTRAAGEIVSENGEHRQRSGQISDRHVRCRPNHARQILEANEPKLYGLICDERLLSPTRAEQAALLQAAMTSVLKKYVESFYRKRQQRWDSSKMVYSPLKKDDENFRNYVVKVPRSDKDLLKTIHAAIEEWKKFQKLLSSDLPNIHFDRNLYEPLLIAKGNKTRSVPPPLNDGERQFLEDLKQFCKSEPALLKGKELFLLRNLSRGKGIGFFEERGFYPDFILWVTEGDKQRLVFIEPHGMLNVDHPDRNVKINLHKRLQTQLSDARKKSKNKNLMLDSFIISKTLTMNCGKNMARTGTNRGMPTHMYCSFPMMTTNPTWKQLSLPDQQWLLLVADV